MDIQATCIKNEQDAQGHHTATLQFANGKTMTMPSERPFIVGNKYSLDVNGDFVDPNAAKPAKPAEWNQAAKPNVAPKPIAPASFGDSAQNQAAATEQHTDTDSAQNQAAATEQHTDTDSAQNQAAATEQHTDTAQR